MFSIKHVIIYNMCYICVLYKTCNYIFHTDIQLCVCVFTDHTDEILYPLNRTLFSCKKRYILLTQAQIHYVL